MKLLLNDKKVKKYEYNIPCHRCIFNRNPLPAQWRIDNCLLRILNLRKDDDWCFGGYGYENMA